MCGIFAYVGRRNDAPDLVFKGIKLLEYRGYDSWGVAFVPAASSATSLVSTKQVGKIGSARLPRHSASHLALGHTRWATHGGVTETNAHPHFDSQRRLAVIHNGIIENFQSLKDELVQRGVRFSSQTDTEVAAHLIEFYLQKYPFPQAVARTFNRFTGLNALVVIDRDTQQIVAVKNGSPIALGKSADGLYIASDATAMSEYTQRVYFLADGDLVVCSLDSARLYSAATFKPRPLSYKRLDFAAQDLSLGEFKHFMLKEIMEQPRVLSAVLALPAAQLSAYASHFTAKNLFTGCGTAYHAALTGSFLLSQIARKFSYAVPGSELAYQLPLLSSATYTTFLSQSGETIDIVEHLPYFKSHRLPYGAVVNRLGSTLERSASTKILLPAGPEQCVLATKSYTAKLAVLFLLAHSAARSLPTGQRQLKQLVAHLPQYLDPAYARRHIRPLARRLKSASHIFSLGRGLAFPTALEAALKIKEVTYIHTEGFAAGELKHGVIALIEPGTPCFIFAPPDETYSAMISNAQEIKSRGGYIIGISDRPNPVFDHFLPVADFGLLSAIPQLAVIQLLAYYLALLLGNDPDKPRNLAKSVTVK